MLVERSICHSIYASASLHICACFLCVSVHKYASLVLSVVTNFYEASASNHGYLRQEGVESAWSSTLISLKLRMCPVLVTWPDSVWVLGACACTSGSSHSMRIPSSKGLPCERICLFNQRGAEEARASVPQ